jgi:hypothetical protein
MAGLDPAICFGKHGANHSLRADARIKSGHDGSGIMGLLLIVLGKIG